MTISGPGISQRALSLSLVTAILKGGRQLVAWNMYSIIRSNQRLHGERREGKEAKKGFFTHYIILLLSQVPLLYYFASCVGNGAKTKRNFDFISSGVLHRFNHLCACCPCGHAPVSDIIAIEKNAISNCLNGVFTTSSCATCAQHVRLFIVRLSSWRCCLLIHAGNVLWRHTSVRLSPPFTL